MKLEVGLLDSPCSVQNQFVILVLPLCGGGTLPSLRAQSHSEPRTIIQPEAQNT